MTFTTGKPSQDNLNNLGSRSSKYIKNVMSIPNIRQKDRRNQFVIQNSVVSVNMNNNPHN